MKSKTVDTVLFLILIILYILEEFGFVWGNFVLPVYFVSGILFLVYYILKSPSGFRNQFINFRKTKIGFGFRLFFAWIIIGIVLSAITGKFIPRSFLSNFLGNFFCSNMFPFLIPAFCLPFLISYKKLCKYLLILYFAIFLLGITEYIGNTLGISFIQDIFKFISNRGALLADSEKTFSQAYGHFRISGVFGEPGAFAGFMFISSPIIYFLCKTKVKLLKKPSTDFIVKKSVIIMAILCFIGTQSPVNLVFMGIFLAVVAIHKVRKLKIKNKSYVFLIISAVVLISLTAVGNIYSFKGIDVSETFLNRILNVGSSLSSMTNLVYADPSLATRVGNYYACFKIGLAHPIFGIGYGNINSVWASVIMSLPFPITNELMYYAYWGTQAGGGSYLFKLIAETGFVGTILFLMFLSNIVTGVRKAKPYYNDFEQKLLESLKISLILYMAIIFYTAIRPIYWVYFGILVSMILNAQNIKKQMLIQKQISSQQET